MESTTTTTIDPTSLDQSALQSLFGGSAPSLIPESLITTLTIGFIVLNILGLLFLVFYVISMIRKWKVESAVLHMRKDLAEIKDQLARQPRPVEAAPTPPAALTEPIQPAEQNQVIAQNDSPDSTTSA